MIHILGLANFNNEKIRNAICQCYVDNGYHADIIKWIGVENYSDHSNFHKNFNMIELDSFYDEHKFIKQREIAIILYDDKLNGDGNGCIIKYPSYSKQYVGNAINQSLFLCKEYESVVDIPKDNFSNFSVGFTIGSIVIAIIGIAICLQTALK